MSSGLSFCFSSRLCSHTNPPERLSFAAAGEVRTSASWECGSLGVAPAPLLTKTQMSGFLAFKWKRKKRIYIYVYIFPSLRLQTQQPELHVSLQSPPRGTRSCAPPFRARYLFVRRWPKPAFFRYSRKPAELCLSCLRYPLGNLSL